MSQRVERTKEVAQRMCRVDKSVDPDLVGNRIVEAGLEFMTLVEWEVSEIAQCLSINWSFARTLKSHARTERDQLYKKGICFQCNFCGAKFAYREMLKRHTTILHDERVQVVKEEPEMEGFIVEDRPEGLFFLVSSFSNGSTSQRLSACLRCWGAASWQGDPPAAAAAGDDQLNTEGCRQRPARGPAWSSA